MTDRSRELEALLRAPGERLSPPTDAWQRIERRARRRRTMKAAGIGIAAAAVVAGAVPAVLGVRSHAADQTVAIGRSAAHNATAAVQTGASNAPRGAPGSLHRFVPDSLSFVSQSEGFLLGHIEGSPRGVIARTTDGGATWVRRPAPLVPTAVVTGHGASQIRFAEGGQDGFVFGSRYYVTSDGGAIWRELATPGYIDDLATMNGKVWALVRRCQGCRTVTLYGGSIANPALRRITAVPSMRSFGGSVGQPGADSIAVDGTTVDVLVGSRSFWSSADGRAWTAGTSPCPGGVFAARVAAVGTTVFAVCALEPSAGIQFKRAFSSTDAGRSWSELGAPPSSGYLQTLAAGSTSELIIGVERGQALISRDAGARWSPEVPGHVRLGFVGFISPTHLVGITDFPDASVGAFASSDDAGRGWAVHRFR